MSGVMGERSVREAAFEVMRHRGMTTIFANPGSTEITFLVGLPDDLRFECVAPRSSAPTPTPNHIGQKDAAG